MTDRKFLKIIKTQTIKTEYNKEELIRYYTIKAKDKKQFEAIRIYIFNINELNFYGYDHNEDNLIIITSRIEER